MKLSFASPLAFLLAARAAPAPLEPRVGTVQGFDISNYQPNVDFASAYRNGARFVIIKVPPPTPTPLLPHRKD
jgi:GH25 family lysozyme M1 (1,4-beta-N-acetylmuramidase)